MSFHMINYSLATGGVVTDADMNAATDPEITQRNSHYIFTESYRLGAACILGANVSRVNIQVPTWNQVTRFNLWPINKSATVPSPPQIDNWMPYPPPIPQNEEITVKVTSSASETDNVFLWLFPDNWTNNLPRGQPPLPVFECRVTATTGTLVANSWSGLGSITFEQSLRGGTYAVVGAQAQGTALLACRFVFPRGPIYHNRRMRPGFIGSQAIGDLEIYNLPMGPMSWGEYGRFSTFEPPQMEYWSTATTSISVEMRWWLVWLSNDMNVTYTQ